MNASTAQKLDPGIHLIEANAGTGKTYRLTDTCLQLLQQPDAGVTMDQFLVLTFTRAAASELTGRIQERVREGLAQHPTDTPTQPAQQLEQALTQIDNATICTTDAFYYLLFQDYGLELGTPFALPAPSDAADNLKRACYLWWRQQIQNQNYQPLQQLDSLGLEDPIKLADWLEKSRQYCGASLVFLDDGASDELDQGISHHNKATATWMRQMDLDISRLELEGLSAGQRPDFSLLAHRLLDRIKAEDTNAHKLRERIRARWKVVLIDESQDNSPIQFEIFRQLFGPPGKRWLFFIGDPKQAIYSFRGADLQQWRQIANPPPDQPPPFKTELTENWRSCNEQIQAVNQVFGRAREQGGQSFVQSAQSVQSEGDQSDLHYAPSKPATQVDPARLISHALEEQHSGTGSAPKNGLEVLTLAIPEATKGIDAVRKYFARVCAAEVAALIQTERQTESQNQTLIKDRNQTQTRPLVPRDIAILVPENKHSLLVQQALMEHGIHSSLRNTESVLRSQEAFWLWHLLRALETPDRPETVAAAIATPLMAPPQNLTEQNQASERLIHYAHKWQRHGIYVTLMALFKEERISHRLIGQPQGARTLTNLLHLSDILQQQQQELLTRSALVQWLENALASDSDTKQDARMRLESDEHLVSIMTIHSSKGLEFPLVYMPFVWDYTVKRQSDALIKTRDDQLRPALYLPDPQHPPSAAELQKQHAISTTANTDERIRLLYVAMTRALCRTSLLWPHELPSKKPPPYIQNILGTAADWQSSLKAWGKLAANSAGCIWIKQLSDADSVWSSRKTHRPAHEPQKQSGTSGGQARSLGKKYPPSLFVTSFSQIKSELDQKARAQQNHYADNEDTHLKLDPMEQLQAGHMRSSTDWHAHSELLDFPGGTQTGLFFHHALECIIEQHLTACNAQDIEHMIQQMQLCERYQLPPDAAVIAASALHQLLHLTLEPAPVCLADLPPDHTASELEFDLPLSPDWHRKLHALNLLSGNLSPLGRTGGRHYMKGFIDLTIVHNNRYYLADLKTNWLGDDIAHYQTENLAQTAQQQHYDMQLNLYGLALHRHLQLRLPDYDYDRHFGGSFLLFIRGLNPKQEGSQGIWFHRLEKQRMLDLDNAIGRDIPPAITHD